MLILFDEGVLSFLDDRRYTEQKRVVEESHRHAEAELHALKFKYIEHRKVIDRKQVCFTPKNHPIRDESTLDVGRTKDARS